MNSAKRYAIKFSKDGAVTYTAVRNHKELMSLLNNSAKGAFVETKIHENMPLKMHNRIAIHNKKVKHG